MASTQTYPAPTETLYQVMTFPPLGEGKDRYNCHYYQTTRSGSLSDGTPYRDTTTYSVMPEDGARVKCCCGGHFTAKTFQRHKKTNRCRNYQFIRIIQDIQGAKNYWQLREATRNVPEELRDISDIKNETTHTKFKMIYEAMMLTMWSHPYYDIRRVDETYFDSLEDTNLYFYKTYSEALQENKFDSLSQAEKVL